jgi:hypothetical protein
MVEVITNWPGLMWLLGEVVASVTCRIAGPR